MATQKIKSSKPLLPAISWAPGRPWAPGAFVGNNDLGFPR
jgi:hypothetical protein